MEKREELCRSKKGKKEIKRKRLDYIMAADIYEMIRKYVKLI